MEASNSDYCDVNPSVNYVSTSYGTVPFISTLAMFDLNKISHDTVSSLDIEAENGPSWQRGCEKRAPVHACKSHLQVLVDNLTAKKELPGGKAKEKVPKQKRRKLSLTYCWYGLPKVYQMSD